MSAVMALAMKMLLPIRINQRFMQHFTIRMQSKSPSCDKLAERVVITDDGSTIVCWHPEKPFPYECSKPIPEEINEESNTVLKVQNMSEVYDVFKPKSEEQTREELMKITCTSKHIWFPRGKRYYKKKMKPTPRDREYL